MKMGDYQSHDCPNCGSTAPRLFEGFGFNFAAGKTPGNSGVAKHDYPTADYAVGSDADKRWAEYAERDKVKKKVREVGGSRTLVRTQAPDHIEYHAAGEETLRKRRKLIKDFRAAK